MSVQNDEAVFLTKIPFCKNHYTANKNLIRYALNMTFKVHLQCLASGMNYFL
jgi:hypothetical protein